MRDGRQSSNPSQGYSVHSRWVGRVPVAHPIGQSVRRGAPGVPRVYTSTRTFGYVESSDPWRRKYNAAIVAICGAVLGTGVAIYVVQVVFR